MSILPRSGPFLQEALDVAYRDKAVVAALTKFQQKGHRGFLVHVMPRNYMMQGLFVQPLKSEKRPIGRSLGRIIIRFLFPFMRSRSHHNMMGAMNDKAMRLIFSQLTWPNGQYASEDQSLNFNVKHLPILKVDIDLNRHEVLSMEETQRRNLWGQMPMPLF